MRVPVNLVLVVALVTGACRQDMHDQVKYEPLEESSFFENGMSSRPLVEGTIAREMPQEETAFHTGRTATDEFVTELPIELNREPRCHCDSNRRAQEEAGARIVGDFRIPAVLGRADVGDIGTALDADGDLSGCRGRNGQGKDEGDGNWPESGALIDLDRGR